MIEQNTDLKIHFYSFKLSEKFVEKQKLQSHIVNTFEKENEDSCMKYSSFLFA